MMIVHDAWNEIAEFVVLLQIYYCKRKSKTLSGSLIMQGMQKIRGLYRKAWQKGKKVWTFLSESTQTSLVMV